MARSGKHVKVDVTPFAGVWIEILCKNPAEKLKRSLPSRECGLKSTVTDEVLSSCSHSLRGSVD